MKQFKYFDTLFALGDEACGYGKTFYPEQDIWFYDLTNKSINKVFYMHFRGADKIGRCLYLHYIRNNFYAGRIAVRDLVLDNLIFARSEQEVLAYKEKEDTLG